jgi:hypothetical protein
MKRALLLLGGLLIVGGCDPVPHLSDCPTGITPLATTFHDTLVAFQTCVYDRNHSSALREISVRIDQHARDTAQ